MAKKDSGKSKTDVTARAAAKAAQSVCRYCGQKPDIAKVLTPSGRAKMIRRCCVAAGVAVAA